MLLAINVNSFELGVLTFLFCLASLRLGAFSVIYPVVFGALVPVEGIAHSTGWVVGWEGGQYHHAVAGGPNKQHSSRTNECLQRRKTPLLGFIVRH